MKRCMGKFTFDGLNWLLVQRRSSAPISLADAFQKITLTGDVSDAEFRDYLRTTTGSYSPPIEEYF